MKPTLQELEKFEATPEEVELEGKTVLNHNTYRKSQIFHAINFRFN